MATRVKQEIINRVAGKVDTENNSINVAVVSRVQHLLFHEIRSLATDAERLVALAQFMEEDDCDG